MPKRGTGRAAWRRRRVAALTAVVFSAAWCAATGATELSSADQLPAGGFSNTDHTASAFSNPHRGLSDKQLQKFAQGHDKFNEPWVLAPDPNGVWGLGPTFNEDRCAHCHFNNGRGQTPTDGQPAERGLLLRISVPGEGANGATQPHPIYGQQIQTRGIDGRVPAEAQVRVRYSEHVEQLADGKEVSLRTPQIDIESPQFGELGADVMTSLRLAQQLVGLGLLEAVPEAQLKKIAADQLALGVSGRPNYVFDVDSEQTVMGRFGWKAAQPSIRQQTASAFIADIGATTYLFPQENCPAAQTQCRELPSAARCGGQGGCGHTHRPEVVPSRLTNITFYLQSLSVPSRRNQQDPKVRRGEQLFTTIGCAACHVPALRSAVNSIDGAAANLEIYPYTDLLLHDMGEGLADNRPEFLASGREWRTPPLWGIGLLAIVNGNDALLHDGRARTMSEAILWHGGEGAAAREAFRALAKAQRAALLAFMRSL